MTTMDEAVQQLLDERDIRHVITTYARAIDRQDLPLLQSCYHPDAVNHNAVGRVTAREFAAQILPQMRALFSATMHHVTHTNMEVKGNVAASESYYVAWHLTVGGYKEIVTFFGEPYAKDMQSQGKLEGGHDFTTCGRYLDRFEKRDGIWRIAERRVTVEWNAYGPLSKGTPESLYGRMPVTARRDKTDPVYAVFNLG
jgi:ketosteroid isomerase-like protein